MANKKISGLTNSLTKSTVATNDLTVVVDTSASESKKMTYGELVSPQDNNFRIAGSADNTKLVAFEVDGLTTATTRTLTVPDANTTIVGTDTTQTLTNKTLTSPQVNFGSDATGDMIYRTSSGTTARLPIGTAGQIIQVSSSGIPEYISNPSASDASTTVKGVVEEATQAEVLARTVTGGTGARLFVNPSTLTTVKTYDYASSNTNTDAYAITPTPTVTAYVTGQKFTFIADVANTGACTLNVNSLGAKTIKKNVSVNLSDGDIALGAIVTVTYDGINFQLETPVSNTGKFVVNSDESITSWFTTNIDTPSGTSPSRGWTFSGTTTKYGNGSSSNSTAGTAAYTTDGIYDAVIGTTNTVVQWNDNRTMRIKFSANSITPTGTNGSNQRSSFIGFGVVGTNFGDITVVTEYRVGFAFYNGNRYIVASDFSAITATLIDAYTSKLDEYVVQLNGTTSADFYINGTLVGSISTSIPTSANNVSIGFGSKDDTSTSCGFNFVSNIILSQKTS